MTTKQFPQLSQTGFVLVFTLFLISIFSSCKKDAKPLATEELQMASDASSARIKKMLDLQLVCDGLTAPLGVFTANDGSDRLFVIDQIGKIWIIDADGQKLSMPFLDISSRLVTLNPNNDERGLLGLAFHPQYASNGKFYVYYSAPPRPGAPVGGTAWNNLSVLSEFMVSGSDKNMANAASERFLMQLDDAQGNHNGGTLAFSPADGYLYLTIGDGGGANDVGVNHVTDWYLTNGGGNGQDVENNLYGNVLRIDVDGGNPYSIPADNPFVDKPGLDEIYAYGLRNPYRFSFDRGGDHDLLMGDVGQVLYEEINVIKKGGNYGWNVKEGYSCFNAAASNTPLASCPIADNFGNPLIDPVIVMDNFRNVNATGNTTAAIIGGQVYRGNAIPYLKGLYIFGSYTRTFAAANGELYITKPNSSGNTWDYSTLTMESFPNGLGRFLKGFGEDAAGEVYITTSAIAGPRGNTGQVHKIVAVE